MKMSEHSPQTDWLETELTSMSSAGDSLAKISAMPGRGQASQGSDPAYGMNSTGSLKKSTRATRSSKTYQPFAIADWTLYSGASLRSGMTRNGTVYPLQPLAPLTDATVSGLLPTPTTKGNQLAPSMQKHKGCKLLSKMANGVGGLVSPRMYEWMMGYQMGWTNLKPSEMPSSRRSQKSSAKR